MRKVLTIVIMLSIVIFLSSSTFAAEEYLWSNESPMTKFLAKYYQVDPIVVISLGQRMTYDDDVSVAIYLAKGADTNPMTLLDPRINKKSWAELAGGLKIDLEILFTPLSARDSVPETFRHAYQEYYKHQRNPDYSMVLYDKEFRNIVQLKLVVDAFKMSPGEVMRLVSGGKTFTSIILEQVAPQDEETK